MNDDNELDPVARLRAADPAAGVEPRAEFGDDVIAQATGVSAAPVEVADLTAARARRRPRWPVIAAVAASVAIVGGAGFGLGAMTGGQPELSAAPPISLPMSGAQGGPTQQEAATFDAGSRMTTAPGVSSMMMPYGLGRNSFSASGLSTAGGSAAAYAFDARGASNTETVAELAAALGVGGTPESKNGSWTVGSPDGTGPTLYVSLDGTLGFSYSNPQVNPWGCGPAAIEPAVPEQAVPEQGASEPAAPEMTIPEMPACQPPASELPSEAAAIDALRSLIAATGRDADAFEYTSQTWEGAVTRMAQAWPVVDGQRIDQAWTLDLAQAGIVSASGALAELVSIGDYDIVSEQAGFERLSDPRFGAQMTAMPFAGEGAPTDLMVEEWAAPTEPPATPAAGSTLAWPVNDVEIVGVRLGLSSQWQPDGSVLVVPAYEFTDADGGTWSVVAVADAELDFE
ncbi:hypothetical protein [Agromyces laixinhei]|uniref:hypothetical protein n=1 Tax=Agromyces laixinhei TaxID=2585717 RepID=UPI0011167757|nr:hypothetical protein [Agromyces laixinhei]